jgi:hypothetical protein
MVLSFLVRRLRVDSTCKMKSLNSWSESKNIVIKFNV